MSRFLQILGVVFAAALLLAFCGCTPKKDNPSVFWNQTNVQKQVAAKAHARDVNGLAMHVLDTGSMEPFLTSGDFVVIRLTKTVVIGRIYVYQTSWAEVPVCHRAAAKHGDGFIMSGDANKHYEKGEYTVYPDQILGEVVAVYTSRTK